MGQKLILYLLILSFALSLSACSGGFHTVKAKYLQDKDYHGYSELLKLKKLPPKLDENARLSFEQVVWAYSTSRLDSAAIWVNQAVAETPADWRMYFLAGLIDSRRGEHLKAERAFQASLSLTPDDATSRSLVYTAIGETFERQEQYGKARQNFVTALNLDPQSYPAQAGMKRLMLLSRADR